MSDSPFDDQQSVNGRLSHLAKIRLEDIKSTEKPIRGVHVTVLASSYGNGPVGSQRSERFRTVKKPEPYKGKGIRYQGEQVRRKAGKTAKGGKAK